MEIVDLLKEEIKKLASEENINVSKLNEYTRIYERLKMFQVTSVQELRLGGDISNNSRNYVFEGGFGSVMQPRDNLSGLMDIFKEAVLMQKPSKRNEIDEYIFWVGFLRDVREDIHEYWCWDVDKDEVLDDLDSLVRDISMRTIELMRKRLEDNISGKSSKEKDYALIPEVII